MTDALERARAAGCPVMRFDPEGDERFASEPFAMWDMAFENGPLFYSTAGRGFFVPSHFDVVREVMQNPATFSSHDNFNHAHNHVVLELIPFNLDPPEHTTYRQLLTSLFAPASIARLEPRIRAAARGLVSEVPSSGSVEFMSAFAHQLPGRFFLEWLGLSPEDADVHVANAVRTTYLSQDEDPDGSVRESLTAQTAQALLAVFEQRRRRPTEDVASHLVNARIDGRPLTDAELVQIGLLLFAAGLETTAGSMGYMFWHLAEHPDDRRRIVEGPELIPTAVDELLRYYSNTGVTGRTLTTDTELAGCPMVAGDRIFLPMPAVNRNMPEMHDARELKLDRTPNRNAVFGLGPHRCLGSHLARSELRIALEEWHRAFPDYRVAPGTTLRHHHSFMTSLYELPLEIL